MHDPRQVDRNTREAATGSILLGLGRALRHAPDLTTFRFTIVSEPRRLIAYRQAILIERTGGTLKLAAVSNVATIDRNAPFVVVLERLLAGLDKTGHLEAATTLDQNALSARDRQEWLEFLDSSVYWQPLVAPGGPALGGLLLVRAEAWTPTEAALMDEIADAGAHAWQGLLERGQRRIVSKPKLSRRTMLIAGCSLVVLLALPVRLSTIAPAEVVARDPAVVAAPMQGVIREVHVKPNAQVRAGDILYSFEDAELKANDAMARRAVEEAEAELRRASQQAFGDAKGRAEIALRQARLALRQEQAAYAAYQLGQVEVRAPNDGIAIFSDANQWRGRPVTTGERVMAIAAPDAAELQILIPVSDAISLEPGAQVRLFLDVAPLSAVDATLLRSSYEPARTPDGTMAYRAVAAFPETGEEAAQPPRIGLKGSAKVLGERVPLVLFLFRRPLAALRQMVGF
ncbi:MAG: HlyD family efflux transporter periplasmic adaptor subunit [Alphaproteobacteria bacterium]|nr:MAG: HlyD family efflux transporter periplasmic adaptor subunit [Alphaproteobacteria bacterium]